MEDGLYWLGATSSWLAIEYWKASNLPSPLAEEVQALPGAQ